MSRFFNRLLLLGKKNARMNHTFSKEENFEQYLLELLDFEIENACIVKSN